MNKRRLGLTISACILSAFAGLSAKANETVFIGSPADEESMMFEMAPSPTVETLYASSAAPTEESIASSVSAGSVLQTDELAELQKRLDELQATTDSLKEDLNKEKDKNKKKEEKLTDPYTVKFGGQVMFDGVFVSQDDESRAFAGNASNSVNFRDIRLTARGTGHGNIAYAFGVSFHDQIKMLDNYIRFKDTRYFGDLTIGHQFVESGMESVEFSFDRVFVTLDEGDGVFRLLRRLGVSSVRYGQDKKTRAFMGFFLAKNINTSPHYISDENPGYILDARLSAVPIYQESEAGGALEALHFGASYYWLEPGGDATLRLKSQGLAWLGSNPFFFDGSIPLKDRSYSVAQVEAAWQRAGFAVTAEGYVNSITDGGGNAFGTTIVSRFCWTPNCMRSYVKDSGRFGTMKMPEETIFVNYRDRSFGRGWGALESVAKWEWTEANNLKNVSNATYGTVNRLVMGVNWFWNEQTFWALNWERAFADAHRQNESSDMTFDTLALQANVKF